MARRPRPGNNLTAVSAWRRHGWLLSLPLAACSATSTVEHSPAELTPIESTRMVDTDVEVTWRRLISRLPAAGLTVVEMDEDSHLVRVSLTSRHPGDFVDCGRTRRTFENGWGEAEVFDYEPAGGASYKLTSYDGMALEARRDVVLEAVATVQMQPSAAMTEARVDVAYDLETRVTYRERGLLVLAAGDAAAVTRAIRFRTDRPGIGDGEVALCTSNGRLEMQILDLTA